MEQLHITIGILEATGLVFALVGTLLTITYYGASKLARVETKVESVDKRLTTIEGTLLGSMKAQSPIGLTDQGRQNLTQSGLKSFIDDSYIALKELISDEELDTAYDIQECSFDLFDDMKFESQTEKKFKEYAFSAGVSMEVLRRIGGIYFRDKLLEEKNLATKESEMGAGE